ncbi:host cell division inhibitor Icd-like protein [Salmonella enterica]|nr:host cell division inhibitor Icd-like protein [Salmonella enterica]EAX3606199.1 host cell division inhibitor Icd-like protein [Salmonella enterica]EGW6279680.1 host cell division inhibitor Icd-like protein [Salmonella enterica]EGX3931883.1 host cell division inhibitor Icd-like protein [Salmonella enterica]
MSMVIICYASSVQQNDSLKNAGYHGEVKEVNIGINNNTGFYSRSGGAGINYKNIVVTAVWGYNASVSLISLAICENFVVIRLVDDAKKIATGHACSLGFRFWCRCTASLTPRPIQYAGYASATRNIITTASFHFMGVSPYTVNFLRLPTSRCYLRLIHPGAGMPENRIIFPLERNIFSLKDEFCESIKKGLPLIPRLGYVNSAPYKTGVGRGNLCKLSATPDAASVFFVVRYISHSMAWYSQRLELIPLVAKANYHAAYNGGICRSISPVNEYIDKLSTEGIFRRQRMVTLAGQPQGWPVSDNTGISTPVNVTALFERGNSGGDSVNLLSEAAVMVATPTQTPPEFIWRFWSCQQSRYITSTADSEREARTMLPASSSRPVFAARTWLIGEQGERVMNKAIREAGK